MAKTPKETDAKTETPAATAAPVATVAAAGAVVDLQAELEQLRDQVALRGEQNKALREELLAVKEEFKLETARAAKLAKSAPAKQTERFRGTLKDAAEEHFQKRNSQWNMLTVIFDVEA